MPSRHAKSRLVGRGGRGVLSSNCTISRYLRSRSGSSRRGFSDRFCGSHQVSSHTSVGVREESWSPSHGGLSMVGTPGSRAASRRSEVRRASAVASSPSATSAGRYGSTPVRSGQLQWFPARKSPPARRSPHPGRHGVGPQLVEAHALCIRPLKCRGHLRHGPLEGWTICSGESGRGWWPRRLANPVIHLGGEALPVPPLDLVPLRRVFAVQELLQLLDGDLADPFEHLDVGGQLRQEMGPIGSDLVPPGLDRATGGGRPLGGDSRAPGPAWASTSRPSS